MARRHRAICSKSVHPQSPRASGLPAAKAGFPLLSLPVLPFRQAGLAEPNQHGKCAIYFESFSYSKAHRLFACSHFLSLLLFSCLPNSTAQHTSIIFFIRNFVFDLSVGCKQKSRSNNFFLDCGCAVFSFVFAFCSTATLR